MSTINKIGAGIRPMQGRNTYVHAATAEQKKRRHTQSKGVNSWMTERRAIPAKEFMEKAEVEFYG